MKPLPTILSLLDVQSEKIRAWFDKQWQNLTPLPYFSCDIRHAEFKLGIVDTNVFPGGFNNLCNSFTHKTAAAFKEYFETYYPWAKNIALLGESFTRNKFYLINLLKLKRLLEEAGLTCRVTMFLHHFREDPLRIALTDEDVLEIHKPGFTADLILTNNDFTMGLPKELEPLTGKIIPHPRMGWHQRHKGHHFKILSDVITRFAREFDIDPWLLTPLTESVTDVHLGNFEKMASQVDELIATIQKKYREYGIREAPYVFIKNDAGTYGLGQVSLASGAELKALNRKQRNKLFSAKRGAQSERFIIQEGIPTADRYSGFPIEPVIYGIGKESVAGFFRIHESKDIYESLNAPGAEFSCLCLHKLNEPHESDFIDCKAKEELVTGSLFLAKLAALAAAIENNLKK